MPEPELNASSFPMARCEKCGKTVLTYVALDGDDEERRLCVHCDGPIEERELSWVAATELEADGYYIGAPPPEKAHGGCGPGGCGSCALRSRHQVSA